jgi:cell division protein FtsB
MTTRGPATPARRSPARGAPIARRAAASGAGRRDGRSATARARPNRASPTRPTTRRATAPAPVSLTKQPHRLAVTTRAALLALAVCLVALTMAYPLKAYLTQRSTISGLQAQQRADQQAVTQLRGTVAQYQNPTSVQDEARRRLHYQMPGDKVYYLPPAPAPAANSGKVHTPAVPGKQDRPWFGQLWGTAVETSK